MILRGQNGVVAIHATKKRAGSRHGKLSLSWLGGRRRSNGMVEAEGRRSDMKFNLLASIFIGTCINAIVVQALKLLNAGVPTCFIAGAFCVGINLSIVRIIFERE
jgi:hypothetical protein